MNDSLQHLDDLEIYLNSSDLESLLNWLDEVFDSTTLGHQNRHGAKLKLSHQGHSSEALITLNAGKTGFSSIWINSHHTPWPDDIAMARAAFARLGGSVRCVDSAWQEGDDPDLWLEINAQGERQINWPNN